MKIQPLKIGTKTAKVPVIQGGMAVSYTHLTLPTN